MADLSNILGGPWAPSPERYVASPEVQLIDAMKAAGLEPPEHVILDGKLHRFRSGTKGTPGHDKSGWYVAFSDGVPSGRFGCWRAGIEVTFRADIGRKLTTAEEIANTRRMTEAKALRDAEVRCKFKWLRSCELFATFVASTCISLPRRKNLKMKRAAFCMPRQCPETSWLNKSPIWLTKYLPCALKRMAKAIHSVP